MSITNTNPADYTPQYVLDSDAKDGGKLITSKYEFDLFHKEDDIAHAVYRVKFIKGTKAHWNLMRNNKILCSISESSFNEKEVKILHSSSGFLKLLEIAKSDQQSRDALTYISKWLKAQ
mgnify:CR=1 FL=1